MSIGSIYHHLGKLRTLVSQDQNKRYLISEEGETFLQRKLPEPIAWDRNAAVNPMSVDTKSLSSFNPTAKLLRFISRAGSVSTKQIKESLGMSTSSVYHYLAKLENFVEQDVKITSLQKCKQVSSAKTCSN